MTIPLKLSITNTKLVQALEEIQRLAASPQARLEYLARKDLSKNPHYSSSWDFLRCLRLHRASAENLKKSTFRQIDYKFIISKNPFVDKLKKISDLPGTVDKKIETLKQDIQDKVEEILSEYISHETYQWLSNHPEKPIDGAQIVQLAFEKFKNRMIKEILLNFEIICLKEMKKTQFNQELIEEVLDGITDIRPYDDFNIQKIKDLCMDLQNEKDISAWSPIINSCISEITAKKEEACYSIAQEHFATSLGSFQEVLLAESFGLTRLDLYLAETVPPLYTLLADLNNVFPKPLSAEPILQAQEAEHVQVDSVPKTSRLQSMMEFALAHPYMTAGAIGIVVAIAIHSIIAIPIGLGVAAILALGLNKCKHCSHEALDLEDVHPGIKL